MEPLDSNCTEQDVFDWKAEIRMEDEKLTKFDLKNAFEEV